MKNKIILFQELFYDKNPKRWEEYLFCINKNLANPLIEQVYFFYDKKDQIKDKLEEEKKKFINGVKITYVENDNERLTFNYLVEFTKANIEPNKIICIANLDIFLENDEIWYSIDEDLFTSTNNQICLTLCRYEYINENQIYKEEHSWSRGEFCDSWFFKTPLKIENSDFHLSIPVGNAPSCDAHIWKVLNKKYTIINWAEKYKTYHYDYVRKPEKIKNNHNTIIKNNKTVNLPDSSMLVKPYQKWEEIIAKLKSNH